MSVWNVPVGFAAGTGVTSLDELRRLADEATEDGYGSFRVSQIFGIDPIVGLAAIAPHLTAFDEVGTSVVPIYGRHPLALAASVRTAQAAVDGRFTLGIGPSHEVFVDGLMGLGYDRPRAFTADHLAGLLPLLAGEAVDHDGEHVTTKAWLTIDAPPTPVLLAAMGTKMLELAGRLTAGTSLGQAVGPETIRTHITPTITATAEAAGRPTPRIKAFVQVACTDDTDSYIAEAAAGDGLYKNLPAYRAMLDREGLDSGAELIVAGDQEAIRSGVQRFLDAGANELRIGWRGDDPRTRAAVAELLAD